MKTTRIKSLEVKILKVKNKYGKLDIKEISCLETPYDRNSPINEHLTSTGFILIQESFSNEN